MPAPIRVQRPGAGEFAKHYQTYVDRVPDGDVVELLSRQIEESTTLLATVSEAKAGFRYAPDKWSIREVVGHLADSERVFSYRALRFARGHRVTVRALAYVIAGHERHHVAILRERYGVGAPSSS